MQDAGEAGLAGVAVNLTTCAGVLVATTTSDATGFYAFNELLPGCYQVSFGIPGSFTTAPQNAGVDDGKDSDVDGSGVVGNIMLVAGSPNRSIAAGFLGSPASRIYFLSLSLSFSLFLSLSFKVY